MPTGMLTIPNVITPFQIGRGIEGSPRLEANILALVLLESDKQSACSQSTIIVEYSGLTISDSGPCAWLRWNRAAADPTEAGAAARGARRRRPADRVLDAWRPAEPRLRGRARGPARGPRRDGRGARRAGPARRPLVRRADVRHARRPGAAGRARAARPPDRPAEAAAAGRRGSAGGGRLPGAGRPGRRRRTRPAPRPRADRRRQPERRAERARRRRPRLRPARGRGGRPRGGLARGDDSSAILIVRSLDCPYDWAWRRIHGTSPRVSVYR